MVSIFGDMRLDRRFELLIEQLIAMPVAKMSQAVSNWSQQKAAYRFLNNKKVSHSQMMSYHREETLERIRFADDAYFLLLEDTTSFNFDGREISGLGVLEDNRTAGFFAYFYG